MITVTRTGPETADPGTAGARAPTAGRRPVRGGGPLLVDRVLAAAAGDRDAFAELVREASGTVFALAMARTRDRAAAEDVTQEVFLRAWERLGELRDPEVVVSWLCGITVRVAGDANRRRARSPGSLDRLAEQGVEPAARTESHPEPDEADVRDALPRCIDALPEIHREVIVLKYTERLSYQRMADALEISVPAVNKRLQKARRLLRECLERCGASPVDSPSREDDA